MARGGLSGKLNAWGDEFKPGGKFMAQHLPGSIPVKDTGEDGFAALRRWAPSLRMGMASTTWRERLAWCSDWYRPISDNCRRPAMSSETRKALKRHRSAEPTEKKRVQKGGSSLCTDQYCIR